MKSLNGQIVRGYEIGERIGSGGYGEVYRATQLSVNRDVAVKVILPQYASNPVFIADFEAEAKLVAQLEHTNIVPLHNYWQDEQGAFLVMRYVRGGSLKEMIERQGALPLAHTTRLIEQIANALAVAHDAGVVHRDLKPANILIDQRGSAYLTDFGIAKQLSGDDISGESGAVKGTFAYMSPERIQGDKVSPQTDIYALGVILYEMLAGRHPFAETPVGTLLIKHMQEPLPDIHEVRDDLPYGIDHIIQKATEKDPSDRYSSVLEVVNDLKAALNSAPAGKLHPAMTTKSKPATLEERNRDAMLTNVRKFWVEGVLENSLHDTAMIDLGLKPKTGAVDSPWDTLIRTPSGDETLTDERIIDVFDRMNGKLLILGDPGSGKTTTLLALARDLLNRAESDDAHPIPVVLNLSSWSENQLPLKEWLVEELNARYQVPRRVGTAWIADDELLLLLDGLDEVAVQVRDACVEAINAFRNEHGFVDIVVCSRIKNYERLSNQLKLNGAIVIQPLTDMQIVEYLDGLGPDVAVIDELIRRDTQLRELAQSPLMLSIMVLAYVGQVAEDVPDFDNVDAQRDHLFSVYVERMFDRRVYDNNYSKDETRRYLTWLARQMQRHSLSVFHIEGLQPNWLPQRTFKHWQWYPRLAYIGVFALLAFVVFALFAPVVGFPVWVALLYGLSYGVWGYIYTEVRYSKYLLAHFVFGIFYFLAYGVIYASFGPVGLLFLGIHSVGYVLTSWLTVGGYIERGNDPNVIRVIDQLEFSFAAIHPKIGLLANAANATAFMALYALFEGRDFSQWSTLLSLSAGFLAGVLILAYPLGITSSEKTQRLHPNEGIINTGKNSVRLSLAAIVPLAIMLPGFMLITSVERAIGITLIFSVPLIWALPILFYGGYPVLQHVLLRLLLWRNRAIPGNLASFLDYATSIVFMRKIGGGYIFIHRYLLEYFAALELEKDSS